MAWEDQAGHWEMILHQESNEAQQEVTQRSQGLVHRWRFSEGGWKK